MLREELLERRVADLFRRAGWQVKRQQLDSSRSDLVIQRGGLHYLIEMKSAPEGRRDRLLPLLAQAILQAQAHARRSQIPAAPLAIVGVADRISENLARDVEHFAKEYAPEAAVGLLDLDGFQWFLGAGLESLNVPRKNVRRPFLEVAAEPASQLFSDLNQWMLKVLLAPGIPSEWLNAPRGEYLKASHLAAAANVSLMSASRFLKRLRLEGFLHEASPILKVVRLQELLQRWQAENRRAERDLPMRWVLRGDPASQLHEAVRAVASGPNQSSNRSGGSVQRICLGLFAAADALGLGLVFGVPPHILVERLEESMFRQLGLSLHAPDVPDVWVRAPKARESVFRGAVVQDGLPVSDAVQIWLDAGAHPSRGMEQADLIYRRVLKGLLEKQ